MKKLFLIGIGAGNPEYITVQAINALNQVDVFFMMDKGEEKEDLLRLRREICERYITEAAGTQRCDPRTARQRVPDLGRPLPL